jgi:molybdopterin/thiamine biosynthesis adenylyltransferase
LKATLVTTDAIAADVDAAARLPVETAGVILARAVQSTSEVRLLARDILWVEAAHYAHRAVDALSIGAEGYVHALGRAEATQTVPVWFHTHPGVGSDPRPSVHDDVVDRQIADLFRLRSGSPYYGALIAAPRETGIAFTGLLEDDNGTRIPLDRLWNVGERFRLTWNYGAPNETLSPEFDRNVRAFGPAVQRTLAVLRIGIVGCGGTGSAVAEQLTRLGARTLTLIDPDVLSDSNVTRVYGSRPEFVGQPKVHVLKRHLEGIAREIAVDAVTGMITSRQSAGHLVGCDVVFGCTDDNAGRLVLSRLSSYFLTPVIDCGVLLTSGPDGLLSGIDGRITTLVPGQGCLVCRNRIDLARAHTELLTPGERKRRIDEGYAPALADVEPAVVTFTTAVAALAVSELLDRLIGFGAEPRPSEVLLRGHEREISTNVCAPRIGHYCDAGSGKVGLGLTDPLLEQTWPDSV